MTDDNDNGATKRPTRRVHISAIYEDRRFQVRVRGTDLATVKRYATALRADPRCMQPITLAEVGTRLLCVDGWHRLAAHRMAGLAHIRAEIIPATEEEALWMAASANLKNPRPLSRADLLQTFRMYVTAKRHRTAKGGFKSYREIASDFANVKAFTTIRNWMMRIYPSVATAMRRGGMDDDATGPQRRRVDDRARLTAALDALRVAEEQIAALGPPRNRPEVMAALADAARAAGAEDGWTPGDAVPF